MAWTTPKSYSAGAVYTATEKNTYERDNLRYLKGMDGRVDIEAAMTMAGSVSATGNITAGSAITAGGMVTSGSHIRANANNLYFQSLDPGGTAVNLIGLAGSTHRQFAAVDVAGFQWVNKAGDTAWMALVAAGLTHNTPLLFTDNTYDIGAASATRPRTIYAGSAIRTAIGGAGTPTHSFDGDTDTGWFSPGANRLAAATGGTARWEIDASGHLIASTDNSWDIGAAAATRPRDIHVGRSIIAKTNANTTNFGIDVSAGTVLTLATNGASAITASADNFSGLVIISDTNVTGSTALFLVGGASILLVGASSGSFSTTFDTASSHNLYLSAGIVTLQNKDLASTNYRIFIIRTRTSR